MTPTDIDITNSAGTETGLSLLALFLNAHFVVQLVILGLILASVWSWAIITEKMMLFASTRKQTDQFEQTFWSGQSLQDLYQGLAERQNGSMAAMFVAAMREWKRSIEGSAKPLAGVQMRVQKVLEVTLNREIGRLERRLMFLATVGSIAPFVGLFGTVWGIMSSFQAIADNQNTNLVVVAPGIAEALFATALGLLAAIPAVIFYNKFSNDVSHHAQRLEGFADEFSAILSRQLDARN